MPKILVIGDSCTDIYIYGSCDRLCPEGPIPVFNPMYEQCAAGMAENTYQNMKVFNDDVVLITNNEDITKTRYIDEKTNQLLLRIDCNDKCNRIDQKHIQQIQQHEYDAIIISDYNKGFLSDEDIIEISYSSPMSFLDSKRLLTEEIIRSFCMIKLNEYEWKQNEQIVSLFPDKFVITLGSKGVKFKSSTYLPTKVCQTFDVSGVGDVFIAALSSFIIQGSTIEDAIKLAQECCQKVIQRKGTCVYEKNMD